MEFITGGVAFEFGDPPFPPVGRRGAILATLVAVPKTTVDEDNGFVFGQDDVRSHKPTPDPSAEGNGTGRMRCPLRDGDFHVEPKTKTEPMQQRADAFFRRLRPSASIGG